MCVCVLRLFLEAEHIDPHPDNLSVAKPSPTMSYTGGNPGSPLPILLTDVKRLQGFQETYTPNLKHVTAKSEMLLFLNSGGKPHGHPAQSRVFGTTAPWLCVHAGPCVHEGPCMRLRPPCGLLSREVPRHTWGTGLRLKPPHLCSARGRWPV